MKIILLKDVAKVGKKYEVKNISDGYAQNLLIPKGLAVAATPDVMKRIELERARDEGEKRVHMELLLKNIKEVEGKTITLTEKANEKGHLFASIHKPEVILAIHKQTRVQISPDNMILDKHIKEVGNHEIELKAGDKSVKFTLSIKAE